MNTQQGRRRSWERREERSRQLIRRDRRVEMLVIRVLTALAQSGRSKLSDLDAGRALSELRDGEGVSMSEVLRLCRGELDRTEVERLTGLARRQSDGRSSGELPRVLGMSADRHELVHLIVGMPDDQVEVLLAGARRLVGSKPRGTWPPRFGGMIEDGPSEGSTAVGRGGVS